MSPTTVRITAPSRLHFGLLSFGDGARRKFGGLGAMIQRPGLRLTVRRAERFEAHGPLAQRATELARRFAAAVGYCAELACRLDVETAPPEHIGLGTGTQLGLAVATGLNTLLGLAPRSVEELARLVGRGARSAIGTHGFAQGGLLLEEGKLSHEAVSPLMARVALPADWRFVLLTAHHECGLYGAAEQDAFGRLPPVPTAVTEKLLRLASMQLLPAAAAADFAAFSEGLYRYGYEAGLCFASHQHGAFASPRIAALVERLRGLGAQGVGQSSWGPTVYCLLPSQVSATEFVMEIHDTLAADDIGCLITPPDNQGVRTEVT